MDIIAEIRRRHLVSGESISSIARSLDLSRPTVRKHLKTTGEPVYRREKQSLPRLGEFQSVLEAWLTTEQSLPKSQRRTAQHLFEGLQPGKSCKRRSRAAPRPRRPGWTACWRPNRPTGSGAA